MTALTYTGFSGVRTTRPGWLRRFYQALVRGRELSVRRRVNSHLLSLGNSHLRALGLSDAEIVRLRRNPAGAVRG